MVDKATKDKLAQYFTPPELPVPTHKRPEDKIIDFYEVRMDPITRERFAALINPDNKAESAELESAIGVYERAVRDHKNMLAYSEKMLESMKHIQSIRAGLVAGKYFLREGPINNDGSGRQIMRVFEKARFKTERGGCVDAKGACALENCSECDNIELD